MGRHHLAPVRTPHVRRSSGSRTWRSGAPTVLSAALLATVSGASGLSGAAFAADDDPESRSSTSAGALDPAGDVVGTAIGTADESSDSSDAATGGVSTLDADELVDDTADSALTGTRLVDPDQVTEVSLDEENGSGASGSAEVTIDRVTGSVSGLDPDERYVSFFYGATSSADNNNPCILDGTNPLPSDQTVGEWDVDENGNGTLDADNPLGARYGLQAGALSIRKVEHSFSSATALPVNPASYSLVSCGEVERIAALDTVTDQVPKLPKLPSVRPVS